MAATDKKMTGTGDTVYDLVSIIYHALQGAETYGMYIADAEEVGDAELAKFFKEVQDDERQRADRAKKLLAGRLGK
jgi:rubrerythrin